MIQKNPFLKYVMKDEKEDVFHSSAYAKAQNGAGIGAASTESFQTRVKIDQNRTKVRGYGDSGIMTGVRANGPHAKTYTPPEKNLGNSGGLGGNATNRAMRAAKNLGTPGKK